MAAIRELAAKGGRNPAEILMFSMFTVILGRTEAEAKAKYADYRSHINPEGALTLMSGWTGVDFSTYDLDQQVRHVENDAGRSAMDNVTRADPDRVWTVREVAQHVGIGGIGPVVVGTPETVADAIEAWFDQTDVDGLNMPFAVSPGDFEDIADMLVPELTRRGRYKQAYAEGTLREKLFGAGPRAAVGAASGRAVSAASAGEGGGVGSGFEVVGVDCAGRGDLDVSRSSFRDGAQAPDPESRDSGFDASHRPGMTVIVRPSRPPPPRSASRRAARTPTSARPRRRLAR